MISHRTADLIDFLEDQPPHERWSRLKINDLREPADIGQWVMYVPSHVKSYDNLYINPDTEIGKITS